MIKTSLLLEQHIHGAFGIDFNNCTVEEMYKVAEGLLKNGIGAFFPTLVTDSIENIKRQTAIIKEASKNCPQIKGIHLEGIFINPEKKGIHNPKYFLELTIDNYKLLEDDFIKIVTLAPELDKGLIEHLHSKNIKVQAGHCTGWGSVDGTTHTFNTMPAINHRTSTTTLSALINDNVYTEIIADGIHVSDEALKLLFKSKPEDKIILISDALPITHSTLTETIFADSKIYYDGNKATSAEGTLAGSTSLLNDIVKRLITLDLFNPKFIENAWHYHNLEPEGELYW